MSEKRAYITSDNTRNGVAEAMPAILFVIPNTITATWYVGCFGFSGQVSAIDPGRCSIKNGLHKGPLVNGSHQEILIQINYSNDTNVGNDSNPVLPRLVSTVALKGNVTSKVKDVIGLFLLDRHDDKS